MANMERRGIYLYINGEQVEASVGKIKAEMRKLTAEINKTQIGTEEYNKKMAQLARLRGVLNEHTARLRQMSAATDVANKSASGLIGTLAKIGAGTVAFSQLSNVMSKAIDDFKELSDAQTEAKKYTGLTDQAVKDLNEDLKKMNTRTSVVELNALAAEAGRLGITGKEQILEFVEAADLINVALGEDLGEGAIKQIGKLAGIFGDSSKSLKENMLSIGSAINEVAQNSSAAESYLVEFSSRVAGAANNANIAVADIMGFASVLDQAALNVEMSGTAMSDLIIKMFTNTAEYAKVAGMSIQDFSALMSEDANAALIATVKGLSQINNLSETSEVFDAMGVSGSRAFSVVSALAQNIDALEKEQRTANDAFREATSVVKEAETQNSSYTAKLEQAQQRLTNLSAELGEKLLPIQTDITNMLATTIEFLKDNLDVIVAVAGAVASYTAVAKGAVVMQKSWNLLTKTGTALQGAYKASILLCTAAFNTLTGNTKKATIAMRAFSIATKSNPIGLAIGLITAAGTALYSYFSKTEEAAEKQEQLNKEVERTQKVMSKTEEAMQRVNSATSDEASRALFLKTQLEANNVSYDKKKKYLQELKSIMPGYNAELNKEGKLIEQVNGSFDIYIKNLQLAARQKALQTELEAAWSKEAQIIEEYKKRESEGIGRNYNEIRKDFNDIQRVINNLKYKLQENNEAIAKNTEEALDASADKNKEYAQVVSDTAEDAMKKRLAAIEKEQRSEEILNKIAFANGLVNKQEYEDTMFETELKYLQKKQSLYAKGSEQYQEYQNRILDLTIKGIEERKEVEDKSAADNPQNSRLEELQSSYRSMTSKYGSTLDANPHAAELAALETLHSEQLISEEEYQHLRTEIMKDADKERRELDKKSLEKTEEYYKMASALMEGYARYSAAETEAETAKIEAEYDKRIEAAGENTAMAEQLEKEKGEKISQVRREQADKDFTLQTIQVVANTAMAISKTMAELGWPAGLVGAAFCTADGAIQLATIKKQHEAAKAGFYEGGYTGGSNPHEVRGYFPDGSPYHGGEFVANHWAVANPAVRSVLDVIDSAQRMGTVSSLTGAELNMAASGRGYYNGGYVVSQNQSQTSGNSQQGNAELAKLNQAIHALVGRLNEPFVTVNTVSGTHGVKKALDKYDKIKQNTK